MIGVEAETAVDDFAEFGGVVVGDWRVAAFANLLDECVSGSGREWGLEVAEFVDDASEGPDVGFVVVGGV